MAQPAKKTNTSQRMTLIQAVNDALACEMTRDPNVLLMGQDVGPDGGVFRATEGLFEKFGADRVLDTPLCESGIIGTAIGLCVTGFRPVAEIQFMGFIYPALNQICAHAARLRNRTRGKHHVPMVIRMPYGGGIRPPEHHSESYESLLVNTPGLKVVIPSNAYDAKGLLTSAIRDDDPVVFLEPKRIYRGSREDVPTGDYEVPLGKARVVREGADLSLIVYGAMVPLAVQAAEQFAKRGVTIEVLDLRSLVPLDIDALEATVNKTGRAVIVHEAPRSSGFGAEIAALIGERCLLQLLAPVARVCGFDTIFPSAELEHHYMPNVDRIVTAVQQTLDY